MKRVARKLPTQGRLRRTNAGQRDSEDAGTHAPSLNLGLLFVHLRLQLSIPLRQQADGVRGLLVLRGAHSLTPCSSSRRRRVRGTPLLRPRRSRDPRRGGGHRGSGRLDAAVLEGPQLLLQGSDVGLWRDRRGGKMGEAVSCYAMPCRKACQEKQTLALLASAGANEAWWIQARPSPSCCKVRFWSPRDRAVTDTGW